MERSEVAYPFDLWILPFHSTEYGPVISPLAHFILQISVQASKVCSISACIIPLDCSPRLCQHGIQYMEFLESGSHTELTVFVWPKVVLYYSVLHEQMLNEAMSAFKNENVALLLPSLGPSYGHMCCFGVCCMCRTNCPMGCMINNAIGCTNKPFSCADACNHTVCGIMPTLPHSVITPSPSHVIWQNMKEIALI